MQENEVIEFITRTFSGVDVVEASGDHFFFCHPDPQLPSDHRMPFATIVTSDLHDQVSHLDRPGVYRLNIGVSRETYQQMFGQQPATIEAASILQEHHDFTALDQMLPHPVYAAMSWMCVLNPGPKTWPQVQDLLEEAYGVALRRHQKRLNRQG